MWRFDMTKKWAYREITVSGRSDARQNGCFLEHRIVAEQKIGRPLRQEEVVHHVDEDRTNNSPENLMVFATRGEHARFHHNGIALLQEDGSYTSPKFVRSVGDEYFVNRCALCGMACRYKYCSESCSQKSRRLVDRPDKETLESLMRTTSIVKIGKMFGVSDNSIRKWAKGYGIPYRRSEIKLSYGNC
jgi:hypothetical protein